MFPTEWVLRIGKSDVAQALPKAGVGSQLPVPTGGSERPSPLLVPLA